MVSPTLILGMFDGVHLGHRAIIERALALGKPVIAYTFDSHPMALVKGIQPPMLMTNEEKREKLLELGVNEVILERFDEHLAKMPDADYIEMLCDRFKPQTIAVGYNHTFGFGGKGGPETISRLASKLGYNATIVESVLSNCVPVSSTRIREHIIKGEMQAAAELLAQPYAISGTVEHGMGIGREIGFPTANIPLPDKLIPAFGVYATRVRLNGSLFTGVTNIGVKPTVKTDETIMIETYLLGLDSDIYEQELKLEFITRLRDEMRFDSKQALAEQIALDKQAAMMGNA